jgi:peptidyl-prolyl cis-trans isomerase SurA
MKIVLTLLLLFFSLYGKMIDKIAIIVNNIPITSYDIQKMTQKTGNKNIAIDTLINDALIKSAIKEKGIYVDEFDVEKKMEEIAKRNGMTLFDFKTLLIQKGDFDKLKKKLKKQLQIDKLLNYYNKRVTNDNIKEYYNSHKNEFIVTQKIDTTIYSSNNPKQLEKVKINPLLNSSNIKIENRSFEYNTTNPRLMQFLSKVKKNSFSKIIPMGQNNFSLFYVMNKEGNVTLPFNLAAAAIFEKLSIEKKKEGIQDLLSKLKAKANIQFLENK